MLRWAGGQARSGLRIKWREAWASCSHSRSLSFQLGYLNNQGRWFMHLFPSFLKICKKWFSNLKHKTKQNSKAGSYFQHPAHWARCASWLVWAPVCSPSYLISREVLTVHQRHLAFHAFILGTYVSLLSPEAASHCSSTKHYHPEQSIYDLFPNQL